MKDQDGRQVAGGALRVGVFTAIAGILGVAGLVYGAARGDAKGVVVLVLAVVALAAIVCMWTAIAVTQRRRRDLRPPG